MSELHFFHFDEAFLTVAFLRHFFKLRFRLVLYDQVINEAAAGGQQAKKGVKHEENKRTRGIYSFRGNDTRNCLHRECGDLR